MLLKLLKFSPYLIIFFSASYLVRFPIGKIGSVNLLDILIIFFIGLFCVYLFKYNLTEELKNYLKSKIIICLILAIIFLGILFSFLKNIGSNTFDSLGIIKSYFLLPIIFSVITSFLVKSKITKLSVCVFAYFASAGLIGLWGIIYIMFNQLSYDGRLKIFFQSPNQLAIVLVPGVIIGFFYLLKKNIGWPWLILLFFTLLQVFCLWKTASLGAWIGLFSAILFILAVYFKIISSKKIFLTVLVLSLISIVFIVATGNFLNKPGNFENPDSTDSRLVIYQVGSKILKENYLFGIGLGSFQEKYLSLQKYFPPFPQWAVPHSHNLFFHLWLENGIITLVFFMILIFYQAVIKKQKKSPLLLGAILVYFLIHGLFDMPIWKNDAALLFWFILLSL